jgi:hypothetical protein
MGGGPKEKESRHDIPSRLFVLSCLLFRLIFNASFVCTRRRNEKHGATGRPLSPQGRNEPVVVVVRQQRHHSKRTESILFLEFSTTLLFRFN